MENKLKVYLAGGMHSNWQQKVIDACPENIYFNPQSNYINGNNTLKLYGAWDISHIRMSDMVVGYMEKDHPSGFGLACELGYARGLGKTVILCMEKDNQFNDYRYLSFMELFADIVFYDFEEMIQFYKSYLIE